MRTSAAVIIIATARCSKDFLVRRRGWISWISRTFLGAPLQGTCSSQICRTGSNIGSGPRCSHNENVLRHLTLPLLNLGGMRQPRLALLALMALWFLLLLFAAAAAATFWSLPHQRRKPFLHFIFRLLQHLSMPIMKLPGDTPLYVGRTILCLVTHLHNTICSR